MELSENPSQALAEALGATAILETSFRAVDEFISSLEPGSFDGWLALGLAARAEGFLIETVGRNRIGGTPDVLGVTAGPGPIDPAAPRQLHSSLWTGVDWSPVGTSVSTDAGNYLCNYLLFSALSRFPNAQIGFLHVPPFESVPFEAQLGAVEDLVAEITGRIAPCS